MLKRNRFSFFSILLVVLSISQITFAKKEKKKKYAIHPKAQSEALKEKSGKVKLSNFYWQSPNGRITMVPFFDFTYFKTEGTFITGSLTGRPFSVTGQIYRAGADVEYGMFKGHSIGGGASYQVLSTDEDVSSHTGIEDIRLYFKGHWKVSTFVFHYGLKSEISPGDKTDDGQGNSNAFSGGYSLGPYMGISKNFGGGAGGLHLSYKYRGERTTARTTTTLSVDSTIEGGHEFAIFAFYESRMKSMDLGFETGFFSTSEKTFKDPTKTNPAPEAGETSFILGAYFPYKMSKEIKLIPRGRFTTYLDDQLGDQKFDTRWLMSLGIDARITF